jgi:hypothetical protein
MQGKKGWRGRQPWTNCELHAGKRQKIVGEDANLGQMRGTSELARTPTSYKKKFFLNHKVHH